MTAKDRKAGRVTVTLTAGASWDDGGEAVRGEAGDTVDVPADVADALDELDAIEREETAGG